MARWQYQQRSEPLVEIVTSDKWAPMCPSRIVVRALCLTAAIVAGSCFLDATPIITIDKWQGSYPSRLNRIIRFQSLDFTIFSNELVTCDKWTPTYPVKFNQSKRIQFTDFTIGSFDYPTLDKWYSQYPNRLDKLKQFQPLGWFDTKLYWFSGSEVITLDKWISNYPDRLDRIKRILWLDWSMVDSYFSHIPISVTMLYFRRYLDDPLETTS